VKKPLPKNMYHVEKYLVPECPKCRHKFDNNGKDWVQYLGDIVKGEKILRKTSGYIIFLCRHCKNMTAQIVKESFLVSDPEKAKALLKEGFVNFQKCLAYGKVSDRHVIYGEEVQFL